MYVHTYIYFDIRIYLCMNYYIYAYMCVSLLCAYGYICMCIGMHIYVCVHVFMYANVKVYDNVCTYVYVCIYVHIFMNDICVYI